MNTKTTLGALVLAAMVGSGLASVAFAQAGGPGAGGPGAGGPGAGDHAPMFDFEALDADKDGKVTKAEMKAAQATRAAAIDIDKDGKISEAELVAMQTRDIESRALARAKRMIERQDSDGDGALSAAELMVSDRPMDKMFDRVDADDDGAISKAEADTMRERMAENREGRGKGHGRDGGKHKRGHGSN